MFTFVIKFDIITYSFVKFSFLSATRAFICNLIEVNGGIEIMNEQLYPGNRLLLHTRNIEVDNNGEMQLSSVLSTHYFEKPDYIRFVDNQVIIDRRGDPN